MPSVSLPYWPPEVRTLWRGPRRGSARTPSPAPVLDTAALEAAKKELTARLDDLDKRVRAAATTAAQADRPHVADPALAELRGRVEALENKPAAVQPRPATPNAEADKDLAPLKAEIATLRAALQSLDGTVAGQKDAIEKIGQAASASGADKQKAVAAARASAVIGIAARLSAALESGLPFAADLGLLAPLISRDDAKLAELSASLQPLAQSGVVSRTALAAEFPAVAKAALADDLADDSFGERLLGKLKGVVSLRRVGADVPGRFGRGQARARRSGARWRRSRQGRRAGEIAAAAGRARHVGLACPRRGTPRRATRGRPDRGACRLPCLAPRASDR